MRHTLVTLSVAGPCPDWLAPYMWAVDGPGGLNQGFTGTEGEAWTAARNAAVGVLGRLEVPGDGTQLLDTIGGAR